MAPDLKKQAEEITKLVKALAKNHARASSLGKRRLQRLFTRIKNIIPECPCLYVPHCNVYGMCKCNITSYAACTGTTGGRWVVPVIHPRRGHKKG
jgi:hypothetical protein